MPRTLVGRLALMVMIAATVLWPATESIAASPGSNGAVVGTQLRSV
jgi:hypothetical protein